MRYVTLAFALSLAACAAPDDLSQDQSASFMFDDSQPQQQLELPPQLGHDGPFVQRLDTAWNEYEIACPDGSAWLFSDAYNPGGYGRGPLRLRSVTRERDLARGDMGHVLTVWDGYSEALVGGHGNATDMVSLQVEPTLQPGGATHADFAARFTVAVYTDNGAIALVSYVYTFDCDRLVEAVEVLALRDMVITASTVTLPGPGPCQGGFETVTGVPLQCDAGTHYDDLLSPKIVAEGPGYIVNVDAPATHAWVRSTPSGAKAYLQQQQLPPLAQGQRFESSASYWVE